MRASVHVFCRRGVKRDTPCDLNSEKSIIPVIWQEPYPIPVTRLHECVNIATRSFETEAPISSKLTLLT